MKKDISDSPAGGSADRFRQGELVRRAFFSRAAAVTVAGGLSGLGIAQAAADPALPTATGRVVGAVAAMTAIDVRSIPNGYAVLVTDRQGGGSPFRYDSESTAPADRGTIFAPDAGPGRWFRQYSGQFVNAAWWGATGDGTTDDRAALAAAAAAAAGADLVFPTGVYRIDRALSLPAGVNCVFANGAILRPGRGATVTISGTVAAGYFRIFDISGGGTVVLARHHEFNPFWWGATGDGSTDDTAALQAALDAAVAGNLGGTVVLPIGVFVTTGITVHSRTNLVGSGVGGKGQGTQLRLKNRADSNVITMAADNSGPTASHHWSLLSNFTIDGNLANNTIGNGIYLEGYIGENCTLDRIQITSCAENGVYVLGGSVPCNWRDIHVFANGGAGVKLERQRGFGWDSTVLNMISGDDNATALLHFRNIGSGPIVLAGVKAESNTAGKQQNAILIEDCSYTKFFIAGVSHRAGVRANAVVRVEGASTEAQIEMAGLHKDSAVSWYYDNESNSLRLATDPGAIFNSSIIDKNVVYGRGFQPMVESPMQLTADVNNYAPNRAPVWRLSSDAAWTITGIVAINANDRLTIVNAGSNDIVLAHQSALSDPANRIISDTGADLTVAAGGVIGLFSDGASARWRVESRNGLVT